MVPPNLPLAAAPSGSHDGPTAAAPRPRVAAPWRTDLAIYMALVALGLSAWWVSAQGWFTPWSRTGYWLGVAGGVAMLLLFTYPLRKRWRLTYSWGPAKLWFAAHMVLGVLGPWLILLHSGFQVASTNAAVALFAMLIVALSGVVGRFLYVRLHADLRGEKASLAALRGQLGQNHRSVDQRFAGMPKVLHALQAFDTLVLQADQGSGPRHLWRLCVLPVHRRRLSTLCHLEAKRATKALARLEGWTPKQALAFYRESCAHIDAYGASVQRVAQFQTFERLFSLWHVAHVPFVWIMVLCAIFHVVAVHAY